MHSARVSGQTTNWHSAATSRQQSELTYLDSGGVTEAGRFCAQQTL
jgi:hypothetical protein